MTTIELSRGLCDNGTHMTSINLLYKGYSFMSFRDAWNIIPHGEFILDKYREELATFRRIKAIRPNCPNINSDIMFTIQHIIILKTGLNLYQQQRIYIQLETLEHAEQRTKDAARTRRNKHF